LDTNGFAGAAVSEKRDCRVSDTRGLDRHMTQRYRQAAITISLLRTGPGIHVVQTAML